MNNIPEVRPIEGYDGYFVSEIGEVYSTKVPRVLRDQGYIRGIMHEMSPNEDKRGYLKLGLCTNDGKRHFHRVHRLVATAFIPNANNYPVVNHKDGDVQNNTVDNLEWCTSQYNTVHAYKNLNAGRNIRVKLTNRQTNETLIFYSIKECARYLNMSGTHINNLLLGKANFNKWKLNDLYNVEFLE